MLNTQQAKERACALAIQRGFALYTYRNRVVAVSADGNRRIVSRAYTIAEMWPRAYMALLREENVIAQPSDRRYCLRTPDGCYSSDTWRGLLWRWFRSKLDPAPEQDPG